MDPVREYKNLLNWMTTLVDKELTPKKFSNKLSRELTKRHPVRLKLIQTTDKFLDKDDFSIGGEYDVESDEIKNKHIFIHLYICKNKKSPWLITKQIVDRLCLELTETLVHEYQHQKQYRKRRYRTSLINFKSTHADNDKKKEQEYLGHPDEVDAYAANISARLYIEKTMLNKTIDLKKIKNIDLQTYYRTFGRRHHIVKELLEKVNENLNYLEELADGQSKRRRSVGRPNLRKSRNQ